MRTRKHTYRFTHEGKEYTRTTHRVYTHAVVLYVDSRYIPGEGFKRERCTPYVNSVAYSSSAVLAHKAIKRWHCHGVILELEQPGSGTEGGERATAE